MKLCDGIYVTVQKNGNVRLRICASASFAGGIKWIDLTPAMQRGILSLINSRKDATHEARV